MSYNFEVSLDQEGGDFLVSNQFYRGYLVELGYRV